MFYDGEEHTRATLGVHGRIPAVVLFGEGERSRASLSVDDKEAKLALYDKDQRVLVNVKGSTDGGGIDLGGPSTVAKRVTLGVRSGEPQIQLLGDDGQPLWSAGR
jgi:hypothetical protein